MKMAGKVEAKESSKPTKKTVRVLLDKDVVEWLKKGGWGWNMRANQMLREQMLKDLEGR
jgi:uncharacterized protein (DUF4415 family)